MPFVSEPLPEDAGAKSERAVRDALGRPLKQLRISVTDRCNFRCTYCMPRALFNTSHRFLPRADLLTFEEIGRITRIFTHLGIERVRLTGGEPTLRRDLPRLVSRLTSIPALREVNLTTNGSRLVQLSKPLREAGLSRVTVSLDSLDDHVFRSMNEVDFPVARVLDGIEAARAAGFSDIRVNTVVKRGVNEHGIAGLVRYCRENGLTIRFIEFMDVGATNGWQMRDVVTADEILARIARAFPVEPMGDQYRNGVAERYRFLDGAGEVGVIASVTRPFCSDCSRLRLSADGKLYTCLFAGLGHDVRGLIRRGIDDAGLADRLTALWSGRNDRYSEVRSDGGSGVRGGQRPEMSFIGG